jgi:ABC-type hemin transport system ATPase subunit
LIRLSRALASAGKLVLITTHDLALATQTDRLLLLGPEGFVADGPPADVLRNDTAWSRLGLAVPDWICAPGARSP